MPCLMGDVRPGACHEAKSEGRAREGLVWRGGGGTKQWGEGNKRTRRKGAALRWVWLIPLIQTKLYVPRPRPGRVQRPRLIERLERGTASKVTLVSAPAGFGKTTLLADWLASGPAASADERSAAWLSLD